MIVFLLSLRKVLALSTDIIFKQYVIPRKVHCELRYLCSNATSPIDFVRHNNTIGMEIFGGHAIYLNTIIRLYHYSTLHYINTQIVKTLQRSE